MQSLQLIHSQNTKDSLRSRFETDCPQGKSQNLEGRKIVEIPSRSLPGSEQDGSRWPCGSGILFRGLSIEARSEFDWLATYFDCPSATVLIAEDHIPLNTLLLLEGQVNISINSSAGRRLLLDVAGAGDILGLTSAISGGALRNQSRNQISLQDRVNAPSGLS